MDKRECAALLKELGEKHLVQPLMVLIEQRKPNNCQLKIKGDYDLQLIETFLKNRGFSFEENENFLTIFKVVDT